MARIAVFLEASPKIRPVNLQIVRLTIGHLFRIGVRVWPYATNIQETKEVLMALQQRGTPPALYVVNASHAEDQLPALDFLIGETPVLFFRRELLWLQSGAVQEMEPSHFSTILQNMTPRLTAIWRFGSANSDDVGRQAARCIDLYLNGGDFRVLEYQDRLQPVLGRRA